MVMIFEQIKAKFKKRLRQRKDTSKCSWIGCRQLAEIGWLGYPLCDKHWDKYCKMQEKKEFKADLREWV